LSFVFSSFSFVFRLFIFSHFLLSDRITQLQEVEAKLSVAGSAGNAVQKISEKAQIYGGAGHTSMSGVNENKKKEEKKEKVEEKNEEEEEEENKIRGYKLTTDGRKTTFFNNELDEKTKALIGSIAPQKIEIPSEGPGSAGGTVGAGSGSAWNSAGTFESVDHCKLSVCTLFVFIYLFFLISYSFSCSCIRSYLFCSTLLYRTPRHSLTSAVLCYTAVLCLQSTCLYLFIFTLNSFFCTLLYFIAPHFVNATL
jgi:hypothetical protein